MNKVKVGAIFGGLVILIIILIRTTQESKTNIESNHAITTPTIKEQLSKAPTRIDTPATSVPSSNKKVKVKVENVVDGDTIKIETGEVVRYIGIDTPETVHPNKQIMCYGKEALERNSELVDGKTVGLEKDISETDKYGRLLRYVWFENILINELLVREGYAKSSTYPPDVKYQDRFVKAEQLAKEKEIGLWSKECSSQNTTNSKIEGKVFGGNSQSENGNYTCNCSKTCMQMSSCNEAQYQLNVCGCKARDADSDGIACDSDCQ